MRYFALVDGHDPGGFLRLTDDLEVELLVDVGRWAPADDALAEDVLTGEAQEVPANTPALRAYAAKAWRALLEEKVTRVVRTAEGAKKYGQPVGTVIVADTLDEMYALLDAAEAKKIKKRKAAIKFYAQRRDGLSVEAAQAKADEYERQALEDVLKDEAVDAGLLEPWEAVPGEQLDVAYPKDDYQYLDKYTDDELVRERADTEKEHALLSKRIDALYATPEDQRPGPSGDYEEYSDAETLVEQLEARADYVAQHSYAVEYRQKLRDKARRLLKAGPEPDRPPVGTRGTYQGEEVEVLELGGPEVDWMMRVRHGDSEWTWIEPGELEPPKPKAPPPAPAAKPKKGEGPHPPSGRSDPTGDATKRGGDGPLFGYSPGQRAWQYEHGDWHLVEVVDGPTSVSVARKWIAGRDGQGQETKTERTLHLVQVRKINEDGTPAQTTSYDQELKRQVTGDDRPHGAGVEDMVPFDARGPVTVDPGYRVEPRLAAVDELGRFPLDTLLPADSLATMKRVFKKKSVALDTHSDVYEGHMTPELVALTNAKADGLRALGRALGFSDEQTDVATARLDEMLDGWAMQGGIFESRLAMHRAVKRLRDGEAADDVDTRAMLLQRAWSHATWDQVYAEGERPTVARFVQNEHAAILAAADALTRATEAPDVESGDIYAKRTVPPLFAPEDVDIDAWTLTSWTVTPDGVHSGWIGRYIASVMLSTEVDRDEVWLNVWSEPKFRSRGLRAPGEVIVDNRRGLNLGNVKVDVMHADESARPSNSFGGPDDATLVRLTTAFAEHVRRHPDSTPQAAAAALELAYSKNLDTPLFDDAVREAAREHGVAQTVEEVEEGVAKPLGGRYAEAPTAPRPAWRYYDKATGELLDRGADKWGSSRYEPPWAERDRYERRLELERDARAEAALDAFAAIALDRGWTQATVNRYRTAFGRWLDEEPRTRALREGKFLAEYDGQKPPTRETYAKRLADAEASVAAARAEVLAGAERLGMALDDAELEALLADQWNVQRAPNSWTPRTSPAERAVPLAWWGEEVAA